VGVIVEPAENFQAMIYALGGAKELFRYWVSDTVESMPKDESDLIDEVEITIIQPRALHGKGPVRKWRIGYAELLEWQDTVLVPGIKATKIKDAPLCVGSHCKFCPAIAVCPAQVTHAIDVAKTEFSAEPSLPSPASLKTFEICKVLQASEIISTWANEVKAYAQTLAERGEKIPGFKLVAGRSVRKWVDEDSASTALESVLGEEAYQRKLIGIPAAEKLMKKKGLVLDQDLITKADAGMNLVPESDSRKEIQTTPAIDFIEAEDFLK
jgi:hypothetical protein